ncbi:hypothetical protein H0H93_015438 [Arthromyces matolae]|nr:hypothetical protein H0H93_015438 [Arthromyces matolae]
MATPANLTTLDISGIYKLNKEKTSKNRDDILRLQSVSWFTRQAISLGTPTLKIKHYKDDAGVERIDVDQSVSGIEGVPERKELTWTELNRKNNVFGAMVVKTRRVTLDVLKENAEGDKSDSEFLLTGWTDDTIEHGVVQAIARSDSKKVWRINDVWGIESIDGERRFTKHLKFTGPDGQDHECRSVYDYDRGSEQEEPLELLKSSMSTLYMGVLAEQVSVMVGSSGKANS